MRARIPYQFIAPKGEKIPVSQLKEAVQAEVNAKIEQVYDEVKYDIVTQLMAVTLCYLNKRYHYKAATLNSIKDGIGDLFKLMATDGIFGKPFTTDNCIEYLESIGVNLEEIQE